MDTQLQVAVIMGSHSDWDTMGCACDTLKQLGIRYQSRVISAHRTPDAMFAFADQALQAGFSCIIAGAGGAAHLPGMIAAKTTLPVLGVPIQSNALRGWDSLLSIAQMPAGIPVATFAIGKAGAINAALFATAMLATQDPQIAARLHDYRTTQQKRILDNPDPSQPPQQ